ncbi:MAG: hypothetical protein IPQ13_13820 [Holophagaceae bacterium]|nr:hypothetical protein [Holophagaceae bacterium]
MDNFLLNAPGLVMFLAGFGIAIGIESVKPGLSEGILTVIGGALIVVADIVYRLIKKPRRMFHHSGGGSMLFLPIWEWGVFWILLGCFYILRPSA